MILGHWAVASLARRTVFPGANYAFIVAAAYGPDLLDKSAKILFGANGRGPAHSLLAFVVIFGAAWLYCRKTRARRRTFAVGASMWLAHLACDTPLPSVLFWPLLGPPPPSVRPTLEVIHDFYAGLYNVPVLIAELLLVAAAVGWWAYDRTRPKARLQDIAPLDPNS
jgi:hypothetical protein